MLAMFMKRKSQAHVSQGIRGLVSLNRDNLYCLPPPPGGDVR
jgi:hypothetical protein